MAWTKFQLLIAFVMLVTGSLNTLIAKFTDKEEAVGRDNGPKRPFEHPFLQASVMFLGELMCLFVFFIKLYIDRRRVGPDDVPMIDATPTVKAPAWVFLPPALCDLTATSIMYVGLNYTYASSFQMLRGAVIIFTALLSVAFLQKGIRASQWIGMFVVLSGLAVVGISDMMTSDQSQADRNKIITGDLLIIMAQIITATQMVYEEKYLAKYNVPALQAVGLEGLFGFVILSLLLIPMQYIYVGEQNPNPNHTLEDSIDAFHQMGNNYLIVIGLCGTILSIAFFNYAGITVTKEINATTRMVLDSMRTLIIWAVSLSIPGWQKFNFWQILGFGLLIIGMAIYNQILTRETPVVIRRKVTRIFRKDDGERDVLVREEVNTTDA